MSELANCLREGRPIAVCHLFGRDHDENERLLLALFSQLEAQGVSFQVFLRNRAEPIAVLKNILESYRHIRYDTRMEMDLESGEPSEEALRWASGDFRYPRHEG